MEVLGWIVMAILLINGIWVGRFLFGKYWGDDK